MPKAIRNIDGDYWSNGLGWTEFKMLASFYDDDEQVELPHYPRPCEFITVSRAYAGWCALHSVAQDRDGDEWGWCLGWLFAVCDTLLFDRNEEVPAHWEFRPSPMGKSSDDEWRDEVLGDMSNSQLLYVGEVLHRYSNNLRRMGKDY